MLIEEIDTEGRGTGYTGGYLHVHVPGGEADEIVRVRITGVEGDALLGEIE